VRKGAFILKKMLIEIGLNPYVMTTGSRGLHVTIPLDRMHNVDFIRDFSRELSTALEARAPDVFTSEMRKSKRNDLIFIDTMRNSYAQTAASPYSVRPLDGAPIATPITWGELEKKSVTPRSFNITNTASRLRIIGDPWLKIYDNPQSLDSAKRMLGEMKSKERRLTVYR
jgi:bifunctional non-homologous end joining protein LigD